MRRPIIVSRWLKGDIKISRSAPRQHRKDFAKVLKASARAARHVGERWTVNSGYRSYAEQERLYELYIHGKGNLAAKPGTSNHNRGKALDISGPDGTSVGSVRRRWNALHDQGLRLPVAGEYWHVELLPSMDRNKKP